MNRKLLLGALTGGWSNPGMRISGFAGNGAGAHGEEVARTIERQLPPVPRAAWRRPPGALANSIFSTAHPEGGPSQRRRSYL